MKTIAYVVLVTMLSVVSSTREPGIFSHMNDVRTGIKGLTVRVTFPIHVRKYTRLSHTGNDGSWVGA